MIYVILIGVIIYLLVVKKPFGGAAQTQTVDMAKANEIFEQWKNTEMAKDLDLHKRALENDWAEYKNDLDTKSVTKAQEIFNEWKTKEISKTKEELRLLLTQDFETKTQQWMIDKEQELRKDAIDKSKSVIAGRVAEQLIPYMGSFEYNPKDARFLGSPIDFVVFDGLDAGELKQIVFVEVKTNKSKMSGREKQVKAIVDSKNIIHKELRMMCSEVIE